MSMQRLHFYNGKPHAYLQWRSIRRYGGDKGKFFTLIQIEVYDCSNMHLFTFHSLAILPLLVIHFKVTYLF